MEQTRFRYAIQRRGKSFGIEGIEQLKDLARKSKIVPQDYVYVYARAKWVKAGQLSVLAEIFAAQTNGNDMSASQPAGDLSAPQLSRSDVGRLLDRQAHTHQSLNTGSSLNIDDLLSDVLDTPLARLRATADEDGMPDDPDNRIDRVYASFSAPSMVARARAMQQERANNPVAPTVVREPASEPPRYRLRTFLVVLLLMVTIGAAAFWLGFSWRDDSRMHFYTQIDPAGNTQPLPIRDINDRSGR